MFVGARQKIWRATGSCAQVRRGRPVENGDFGVAPVDATPSC
jgi:hypothetical protein